MITLLRGGDLYDPEPRGRGDLLLAGRHIAALGDGLSDAPSGWPVEEVDVSGLLVVPGLVDTHTHMTGGGGEGGAHTRVPPLFVEQLTRAGVTTAIGLLGTDGTTRSLAELLASARGLAHYGLTALTYTGGYEVPPPTLTGSVRGDLVHVDRMVAVGELAISDHRSAQPTLHELLRIAADAHVSGLMTGKAGLVHLHLGDGPRGLSLVREALAVSELPPRVFHPTHCNRNRRLWEEAKDCAPLGLTIDVTAFPKEGDEPSAGEALAEWLLGGLPPARLTMSSDGGGCLPRFSPDGDLLGMGVGDARGLLDALREATALGVPFQRALATCTANPAALFRLRQKGQLAPGLDADVTLLTPELTVWGVIAGGRWLVREGRAVVGDLFGRGGVGQ
ncbi:MAG: beta-aspartyl-peptidase [Deltaproteobacteria bacterium]|nr:beta-aspartyl-peptidase [Deltaproteobacteria bacterium]